MKLCKESRQLSSTNASHSTVHCHYSYALHKLFYLKCRYLCAYNEAITSAAITQIKTILKQLMYQEMNICMQIILIFILTIDACNTASA